jgi:hypothetical protein
MEKSTSRENTTEGSVAPDQVHRPEVDTSNVDERKLMRKIDLHVIPWLAFVYLLNFLDRGSIGNAKVSLFRVSFCDWPLTCLLRQLYNLETDINIKDNQFLIALTVFFFPYALFEVRVGIVCLDDLF